MLDKYIVPRLKSVLSKLAEPVARQGISADQMTVIGFVLGMLAVVAVALSWWMAGLVLLLLGRLADGLDGELARRSSPTDHGAFIDITLDFVFYAMFPLGFAIADPAQNALAAAVLIASFVGTGASFLAFARFAVTRNLAHPEFSYKGLYYLDGLAEGTETIVFFALLCVFPDYFSQLAWLFALLCIITAANRIIGGYHSLKKQADQDARGN